MEASTHARTRITDWPVSAVVLVCSCCIMHDSSRQTGKSPQQDNIQRDANTHLHTHVYVCQYLLYCNKAICQS